MYPVKIVLLIFLPIYKSYTQTFHLLVYCYYTSLLYVKIVNKSGAARIGTSIIPLEKSTSMSMNSVKQERDRSILQTMPRASTACTQKRAT